MNLRAKKSRLIPVMPLSPQPSYSLRESCLGIRILRLRLLFFVGKKSLDNTARFSVVKIQVSSSGINATENILRYANYSYHLHINVPEAVLFGLT